MHFIVLDDEQAAALTAATACQIVSELGLPSGTYSFVAPCLAVPITHDTTVPTEGSA